MSTYYDLGRVVGPSGTIAIGTVTTGESGTPAAVENVGTPSAAILNFTIPRGIAGQANVPGGVSGQVLTRTADSAAWQDLPGGSVNGILKGNGAGGVSAAVAGADFQAPLTAGTDYARPADVPTKTSDLINDSGFLTAHQDISGKQDKITVSGVLQGNGNGSVTAKAVDAAPASGSSNLITSGAVYTAILGAIGGSY